MRWIVVFRQGTDLGRQRNVLATNGFELAVLNYPVWPLRVRHEAAAWLGANRETRGDCGHGPITCNCHRRPNIARARKSCGRALCGDRPRRSTGSSCGDGDRQAGDSTERIGWPVACHALGAGRFEQCGRHGRTAEIRASVADGIEARTRSGHPRCQRLPTLPKASRRSSSR